MSVLDVVLPWARSLARPSGRPLVLGIQGPQGCGKSTLATSLCEALRADGLRAATLSIDDVYLTRAEQIALSARFPGNRYLAQRGYPGTHDVALGTAVIDALRSGEAGEVRVPRYDKSAHGGLGDRAPVERWEVVATPLDVVVVEGWMLGFTPVDAATLGDPDLVPCNEALAAYAAWHARIDGWVVLEPLDPVWVVPWRIDAERARRERGEDALSDEAARDYVERFLPAYATWRVGGEALRVRVGRGREVFESPA